MPEVLLEEIPLYRVEGRWEDAMGISWFDTGVKIEGRRVYTDGSQSAYRAGAPRDGVQA